MAVSKKNEKGRCPFRNLKPCSEECAFYRKGIRYSETNPEPVPFENCAINIIADNLEAMHNRTFMLQQEVGETKNMMALKTMVDLQMARPEQAGQLKNIIQRAIKLPDPKKSLE